jgi:hypothetical protein
MTADDGSNTITTMIDGLQSGVTYRFNYRAQNIHGWSTAFSDYVEVKTLKEPETIGVPVTTNQAAQVKLKWVAPYSGGNGIAIT